MSLISRITKTSWKDHLRYFTKNHPIDIWEFTFQDNTGRVENDWKKGASLYINGNKVDINKDLFAIKGKKPLLSFSDEENSVDVYVKALIFVRIKVKVNGLDLDTLFM